MQTFLKSINRLLNRKTALLQSHKMTFIWKFWWIKAYVWNTYFWWYISKLHCDILIVFSFKLAIYINRIITIIRPHLKSIEVSNASICKLDIIFFVRRPSISNQYPLYWLRALSQKILLRSGINCFIKQTGCCSAAQTDSIHCKLTSHNMYTYTRLDGNSKLGLPINSISEKFVARCFVMVELLLLC